MEKRITSYGVVSECRAHFGRVPGRNRVAVVALRVVYPGLLVPRNPGLCCGIPLGFSYGDKCLGGCVRILVQKENSPLTKIEFILF